MGKKRHIGLDRDEETRAWKKVGIGEPAEDPAAEETGADEAEVGSDARTGTPEEVEDADPSTPHPVVERRTYSELGQVRGPEGGGERAGFRRLADGREVRAGESPHRTGI